MISVYNKFDSKVSLLSARSSSRMNTPSRKRYERPKSRVKYVACDVYFDCSSTRKQLTEAAAIIFKLTLDCRLGGVGYDGAVLKRLGEGILPPVFVDGTEPELEPFSLYIRLEITRSVDVIRILEDALTCNCIRDVRVDGRSVVQTAEYKSNKSRLRFCVAEGDKSGGGAGIE